MSIPTSAQQTDAASRLCSSPLVHRVFGEVRFHTDGDIAGIAFASDDTLFSIDEAGWLCHWATDGRQLARHFLSDLETLWCFAPGAKLLVSGNDDIILWDTATGQLSSRIELSAEPSAWVTALAFSADGRVFASGHEDGSISFWDVAAQKRIGQISPRTLPEPHSTVSAIAFAPTGDRVATAGEDRIIRIWDADSYKLLGELTSHTDRIPALVWSPDGQLLISAGWDTSARTWRPPHPDPVMLLNSHAEQVVAVAYGPDGKYLACADSDFDIHLWTDPEQATRGLILRGHTNDIRCLVFSADGTKLASGGADRLVHLWDVRDGKLLAGPNTHTRHTIAVIPGNPLRLASSVGHKIRVWNVENGNEVPPTNLGPVYSVAASPDGHWLALGGTNYFTQLWNAATGELSAALEATKPPIGFVTFSPDSRLLAHTSPADGLVWLWTCATGQPLLILIEAADACTLEAIAFHPNNRWIACGGIDYMSTGERDGAVCVWDFTTTEKLYTIDIGVSALTFDPQGKYLAGAGLDDAVYLWDAETQDTIFVLGGHSQKIHAIAFDPTGSYLLSADDEGTVRCWDVLSGRQLVARAFDSPVQALAFSPDGQYLFCGSSNTTCLQIEFKKFLEE